MKSSFSTGSLGDEMKKLNTIEYSHKLRDYLINDKPLLEHLKKHEGVDPGSYMPAFLSERDTKERLLGECEPDLLGGHVAIYLCGYCGGYDGSPIGVKVVLDSDVVHCGWKEIGHYSDIDEELSFSFKKVTEYTFSFKNYLDYLSNILG